MARTLTESNAPGLPEPIDDAALANAPATGGTLPPTGPRPAEGESPLGCLFAGRYLTERELGRGGMGRVLLAEDERLGRKVALKIVRADASDTAAIAQLVREARLVASLHHANILQVHDIGTDAGAPFLVHELLQGRTLKEELAAGPLPPARALELALQAARGVAAAHEQGVVHCDLKPSNLFVTTDGTLKILDFGIARLQAAPEESRGSEESGKARRGFSGTPLYSSPEQLRCDAIDGRSDLFSLGVVLYEMLSGRRPFTGKSQLMISFAVLTRPVPPLPKAIPRGVQRLVARCLEKDPARRYQTATELVTALELELARKALSRTMRALQVGAAVLLVLAALGLAGAAVAPHLRPAPTVQQITHLPGAVWTARFAADGQTIFYGEAFDGQKPRVLKTQVGSPEQQEEVRSDALVLSVSPTGELAVLLHPEYSHPGFHGTLATLAKAGAEPRLIAEHAVAADFAPDGTLAVSSDDGNSCALEFPAGTPLFKGPGKISQVRVSPQGDRVAFLHLPRATDTGGDVVVVDRRGETRTLVSGCADLTGLAWSSGGDELFFSGLPPDAPAAVFTIRAVSLGGRIRSLPLQNLGDVEIQDVSREGRVLLTQPGRTLGLSVADERGERVLSQQDEQLLQDLSADGERVLFTTNPRLKSGDGYIWSKRTDGSAALHIGDGYGGALSPDGTSALIFPRAGSGLPLLLYLFATGATQPLPWATIGVLRARYFADGRRVLLVGQKGGKEARLFVLSLDDRTVSAISDEPIDVLRAMAIAPDGRTVAAVVMGGAVTRWSVGGGAAVPQEGAAPGQEPYLFDASGGLLVGAPEGNVLVIDRLDLTTRRREPWRRWRLEAPPSARIRRVILSQRGTALAYSQLGWKTHLYLVKGLR